MNKMERISWVIIALLAGALGFSISQLRTKNVEQVFVEVVFKNDVSNEIDNSFGWGKAPDDIKIEAIDVIKGVRTGGDQYPYPMPVLSLSLKNIGDADLDSFRVNVLILDKNNKRKIAAYGQASGCIRQGWSSGKILLDAAEEDWKYFTKTSKINFPVTMVVFVRTNKADKNIISVIFDPSEIDILPELS